MKKIGLIIILIFIISLSFIGIKYYKNNNNDNNDHNILKDNIDNLDSNLNNIDIDDNKTIIGLYKYNNQNTPRVLMKEYSDTWQYHQDIISLEVFYTNDNEISGSTQRILFDEYRNLDQNSYNYKIGYIINFITTEGEVSKTIISPKDTLEFFNYLEIYLYDDYHRHGEWYSHTTEEEYNDETILTSIKLTAGIDVDKIISDIHVTGFTYDQDDFDINGNYLGNSKYSVVIKNI